MYYLIRDAARDYHPVIGIGALGSSIVQITSRDNDIGWTFTAFKQANETLHELAVLFETDNNPRRAIKLLIKQALAESKSFKADLLSGILAVSRTKEDTLKALEVQIQQRLDLLQAEVDATTEEILWHDLLTTEDVSSPTQATLEKLDARIMAITEEDGLTSRAREDKSATSLAEAANTNLYRRKRAVALRKLLKAKVAFRHALSLGEPKQREWLFKSKEGKQALATALRSLKQRHIGASMMDITTCGAVAPYNELLGGSLSLYLWQAHRL